MIQNTSLEIYNKIRHGNFCKWQKDMTLKLLDKEWLCGRDMASRLKVELYAYRPRLTALKKNGLIMDSGERKVFHYKDRNGAQCTVSEILWRKIPKSYSSGHLF
ncbi:MAG: hypothetical protein KAJ48_00055 [Elusimicrobiales bacterium]|nr:hypothetical protein [Elusimicrobiales bacterium]